MKLELPGIMICEWDAETNCIIVSPADGWKVNVNHPISEAHDSMVTMEKIDMSVVGKWLKCIDVDTDGYQFGKWYRIVESFNSGVIIPNDNWDGIPWFGLAESFDLTDARDYNPDERKPHQLKEYDAVECNAEERAEIIRIADECGVRIYGATQRGKGAHLYPHLVFTGGQIVGTERQRRSRSKNKWHTVPDFIAKIRGTYVENEVNVSEHKHPEIV